MITLRAKDGITEKAEIKQFSYSGTFMGECYLTATIESPTPINFEIGDYCLYRGERFELNYIPAKEKQASAGSYGSAFKYDNIKFNSLFDELTRVEFLDIVQPDNGIHYTSKPDFDFYASSVQDLADRIQANLDAEYTGSKKWTVVVLPELVTPDKTISVSGITVWDAVALANTEFKANFIIRNRTITIGTAGYAVGAVFGYGKGKGLYDIQQVTNQDAKIITRLRAYGSTRNMPYKYYNTLKDGSGNSYIAESLYMPNLMLPDFPYVQNDPKEVYLQSASFAEYGTRYGHVYFDDSNEDEIEIYPSIEGMTADQLAAAGITVSLPSGDNGIINEILGAENPTDDGIIPELPLTIPKQFVFYLKDLGFDLSEKGSDGKYKYATADTMQISMKSGMCIGRTFDVVEYGITKDTSLGYTRFKVECNRFEDESVNMAYPNANWKIEAGDKFVILGIAMPEVYIKAASQKLLTYAQEYLAQNDSTKYTYTPKIDEIFMANHPILGESIKEGDIFNFTDTDLDIDASVIIQSLTIKEGDKIIPTYEVTLSNDRIAGTIEKMQNAISSLQSNAVGLSIDAIKAMINSIGGSLFLSKRFDDVANGLIKFVRGLNIGDFATGAFGSGGTFRMQEGDSYLEVDKLSVRKWAKFTEIIIERLSHIGGELVLSPARMICSEVEELTDSYRCYFDKGDNDEFVQEFVVNDQARCQVFTGSGTKYYWRLVTAIGDNYIELSKTDMDSGSDIPAAGDHIVQLGNRDNTERQNAQILSSFGIDAPSYKQYQGINSYSLVGTEKTVISPEGNKFEGAMTIKAGSTGWNNIVGLPEEFQSLSTGAVNLLRNTGFTGDYESKELTPETELTPDTPLFSNNLKFWDGEATINEDVDSESGFSATLTDTTLSQTISPLIQDENYIVSLKGKGQSVTIQCGDFSQTVTLTENYARHILPFSPISGSTFSITGRGTVCEIQLERGKIVSGWSPSPLDNNKALEAVEAIRYISDSVRNGNTSVYGGLILSSMIQLGNYIDGTLKKVTAIMSGIYNDDRDTAFAAGGNLQKAIYTSINPYSTDETKYINFLVTHGGLLVANNAIIRGHIDAKSGTIGYLNLDDGILSSQSIGADGKPNIIIDGNTGEATITGRFQSNNDNNEKVIIDPNERSLQLVNKNGDVVGNFYFYSTGVPEPNDVGRIDLFSMDSGNVESSTIIVPDYIELNSPSGAKIQINSMGILSQNSNSSQSLSVVLSEDGQNTKLNISAIGMQNSKNDAPLGGFWVDIDNDFVVKWKPTP